MSTPTPPHVVVVDARLRRAMVREVAWRDVKVLRGRVLTAAWLGWLVGVVVANNSVGLAGAAAAAFLFTARRWWLVRRLLSRHLPVGQAVKVSVSGDTLAIHATDEVWLPRGSVTKVERLGAATVVFGRTVSTIVPSAALTQDHAAFLEGHAPIPDEPAEPVPEAGHETAVTAELLETLARARRRSYLRSGVLGVHVFTGLLVSGVALGVAISENSPGFLVLLLVPALSALAVHRDLRRGTRALVEAHPIGSSLAVHVDADGLRVTRAHGTVGTPWATWQAVRTRPETVELRMRPGQPLSNLTLPRALMSAADIDLVRERVGREF